MFEEITNASTGTIINVTPIKKNYGDSRKKSTDTKESNLSTPIQPTGYKESGCGTVITGTYSDVLLVLAKTKIRTQYL